MLPATFTVTNPGDANDLSPGVMYQGPSLTLREAIQDSNLTKSTTPNEINFHVTGNRVLLIAPLQIQQAVTITGGTPGGVVIEGFYPNAGDIFDIEGNGSTLLDLTINTAEGNNIAIFGNNNKVQGCYIGTGTNGTPIPAAHNQTKNQIQIYGSHNTIGGTTAAQRNVIAGSSKVANPSIVIGGTSASYNEVIGNAIGTDMSGTHVLGNAGTAIFMFGGANHNQVRDNILSGNSQASTSTSQRAVIDLVGSGTSSNTIAGNSIGTAANGNTSLGNNGLAIRIDNGASLNTIGGTSLAARNIIAGNRGDGIDITSGATKNTVEGNYIGITKSGTALGNSGTGILITAPGNIIGGTTATARNIISANTGSGIQINTTSAKNNTIEGNYIGTNPTGSSASAANLGNHQDGVDIGGGASGNIIGGPTSTPGTGPGNVISNNVNEGIAIFNTGSSSTTNNKVEGNCIGTDASGTHALGNKIDGVAITAGATHNSIGGVGTTFRNLISGNARHGVLIYQSNSNTVAGNYIGTDIHREVPASGANPLANQQNGVLIFDGSNNTIGAAQSSAESHNDGQPPDPASNVIRANGYDGVYVFGSSKDNRISLNVIYGNGHMGIDLGGNITTLETGSHSWQAYPIITSIHDAGGQTTIQGRLMVTSGTYTIQLYANAGLDASGLSEGQWYLGTATATYNAKLGFATFSTTVDTPSIPDSTTAINTRLVQDHFITGIAIDSKGNTSEFSPARDILRNAVYLYSRFNHDPQNIAAYFIPNMVLGQQLTIDQAAHVAGVDHFNWLQYLWVPAPWRVYRVPSAAGPAKLLPNPVPDPALDYSSYHYELRAPGQTPVAIGLANGLPGGAAVGNPTDNFRFYWNEVNEPTPHAKAQDTNLSAHIVPFPLDTSVESLEFGDHLVLPARVAGTLTFETSLVGVPFAGGTASNETEFTEFSGLESNFVWHTSQAAGVSVSYLVGAADGVVPAGASNGL